jgi:uncharacterized SAM-binding protein YcdF (DUF218 family)
MYLIKQVLGRFLFPVSLCLEVFLIGLLLLWFTRKQKAGKTVVTLAGVMLFCFGSSFFSNLLLSPLENRYPTLDIAPQARASAGLDAAKFIVVLAGGFSEGANRPVVLRLNEASIARLVEGVRLSKELKACKLVLSGGKGTGAVISSAEAMAQLAQSLGVIRQDMILETGSRNTADQAMLVKPIVRDQPCILVTEASHMPRAMALFRKQGTHPIADPVDFHSRQPHALTLNDFYPSTEVFYGSERAVYEYLGLALEKMRGQI